MNLHKYTDASVRDRVIYTATGIDYSQFEFGTISFDYQRMMDSSDFSFKRVQEIQGAHKIGNTPLFELRQITALVRSFASPGMGARILLKDEAVNASGSFKARRASVSVQQARDQGYEGVIAATSGNYGAAVASQAAMHGLRCIVIQEAFDSHGRGQPEILEKARACEAYGAEVVQLTVGPEIFLVLLAMLDRTGFFSSSLYLPQSILGIETLGVEIAEQVETTYGRYPDVVLVSHAGGGNLTGTARGLLRANSTESEVVAVSVNLRGLHMASDNDFNRKSFTTSHTGFSRPFLSRPDRVDVPRNAARPLRYMDRFVTVEQGEVFYATELLAQLEGLERGPAGNTALAAAIPLAAELPKDHIVVVQESEYTGAGKSHHSQLTFARDMGIEVMRGNPRNNVPGRRIVIPNSPEELGITEVDLEEAKRRFVLRHGTEMLDAAEIKFLSEETQLEVEDVRALLSGNVARIS